MPIKFHFRGTKMLTLRRELVTWCQNFIRLQVPKISEKPVVISNIYLRDNSQEDSCYNHKSLQRIHNTSSIPLDIHPLDVKLNEDSLSVEWSDKHKSSFTFHWIRENVVRPKYEAKVKKQTWKAEDMNETLVSCSFEGVLNDDEKLKQFYRIIWKYGFCLVTDCPIDPSGSMKFARHVGAIMQSREYFDHNSQHYVISSSEDHDGFDIAYTNVYLPLHTDNPDFEHPGSLLTLQPIKKAELGGHSTLMDAFYAAEQLKQTNPAAFEILTTYPVNYIHHDYMSIAPMIELHDPKLSYVDYGTDIKRVKYAEPNRGSWQPLIKQEQMKDFYEALSHFSSFTKSRKNIFKTLLPSSTMLVIDNWRMLHGRTAFKGDRKVAGCYIPYEDWTAKARKCGAI